MINQEAFFDELEKIAGLGAAAAKILEAVFKTPARKFVLGALLGSALYNDMGKKEKEEFREAAKQTGGSQQPIIVMPPSRMDAVQRELDKKDPEDTLGLGRLSDHFAPDVRALMEKRSTVGMLKPPEPPKPPKVKTELAAQRLKQSQNIGVMGRRQPPKPNIRAVATKI